MARAVFLIDGNDVAAYRSVEEAEAATESHDTDSLTGYLDDGTRLELTADWTTYRCRMRRTDEQELSDLQDRLRRHLSATGLDTALADDLPHLAVLLMERQKDELWPRWPRWLHRLVHRNSAAR